jgi:hypothetical protein
MAEALPQHRAIAAELGPSRLPFQEQITTLFESFREQYEAIVRRAHRSNQRPVVTRGHTQRHLWNFRALFLNPLSPNRQGPTSMPALPPQEETVDNIQDADMQNLPPQAAINRIFARFHGVNQDGRPQEEQVLRAEARRLFERFALQYRSICAPENGLAPGEAPDEETVEQHIEVLRHAFLARLTPRTFGEIFQEAWATIRRDFERLMQWLAPHDGRVQQHGQGPAFAG